MLNVYFVRHPLVPANLAGDGIEYIVQGPLLDEDPLPGYEEELRHLGYELSQRGPILGVIAGKLKRQIKPAYELFELFLEEGHRPAFVSTEIMDERNWGIYNGRPYSQVPNGPDGAAVRQYLFSQKEIEDGEGYLDLINSFREFHENEIQRLITRSDDLQRYMEESPDVQRQGQVPDYSESGIVVVGSSFKLLHLVNYYLHGDPGYGQYEHWENLGVRHFRIEGSNDQQRIIELPFEK